MYGVWADSLPGLLQSGRSLSIQNFTALRSLALQGPDIDERPWLFKSLLKFLPKSLESLTCGLPMMVQVKIGPQQIWIVLGVLEVKGR